MKKRIRIEVEVDIDVPDDDPRATAANVTWNVIDAVYHTPDVITVVQLEFRPDQQGGMWHPREETRRR